MTTITYQFGGYDGGSAMTDIFENGKKSWSIVTPKMGIVSSWQELELAKVEEYAIRTFGEGNFLLPYYVDQNSGYVYKNNS